MRRVRVLSSHGVGAGAAARGAAGAGERFGAGCALVIGGSGLFGGEICRQFADAGSPVAFTYRANRAAADELSADLHGRGSAGCWFAQLDLRDFDAVVKTVAQAKEKYGAIHTVVYASGPDLGVKYLADVDAKEFQDVIMADVVGFFNLTKASIPALKESRGSLVAVSTAATERVIPTDACSAVPKAAVNMICRHAAREYGRFGVRANVVAPGFFLEPGNEKGLGQRMKEKDPRLGDTSGIPMRRAGRYHELADAVIFVASKRASYITGQTLAVDGGTQL